ncbi:glucosyltransferase domain-containing protein [Butyrivibrio sp. AE3006]|uniref:glucosyltransferase domain-containing protein n=1 Tax=Butyrivibrio sp. AE3006 TaxID=1280673 RepID=UPI001FA75B5A|nr:glucosyltransferase domain-containing protein [Butyrivibrio sp. AE3006]
MIFSTYFYQDLGVLTRNYETTYNWYDIGRYGLVLLRYVFRTCRYNVYYTGVMLFMAMTLTVMFYSYFVEYITKKEQNELVIVLFAMLFFVHTAWSEQFYFQFQSFEIVFGVFLVGVALFLLWSVDDLIIPSGITYALSIGLAVLAFGVYQAMLNVYITSCIGLYLLDEKRARTWMGLGKDVFRHIVVFLVDFAIYELIIKITVTSTYLTNQIAWGNRPALAIWETLKLDYIERCFTGKGALYSFALSVIVIFVLLVFCYSFITSCIHVGVGKVYKGYLIDLILLVGLVFSSFILGIVVGFTPAVRAQLALPISIAFLFMYLANHIFINDGNLLFKYKEIICILCGAVALYSSLTSVTRMLYTYDMVATNSYFTATKLSYDLDKKLTESGKNLPIAFIGIMDVNFDLNELCVDTEHNYSYMLEPMMNQNGTLTPTYYWGSMFTHDYFGMYGINYLAASMDQVLEATDIANEMPEWPAEGSIVVHNDYIIAKIGKMID